MNQTIMDRIAERSEMAAWTLLLIAALLYAIWNLARGRSAFSRYTPFK